jgi:hypothetical protein
VYLPAIEGYVPSEIVKTIQAFLEFCYIVRHDIITEDMIDQLDDALTRFLQYRAIFEETGARPEGFALPRQHSMVHYHKMIRLFGAPNGLCTSITELKHRVAVKQPWRRSSRYKALGQMLLINQRLDKLAAARIDFTHRGMLDGTCLSEVLEALNCLGEFSQFLFLLFSQGL